MSTRSLRTLKRFFRLRRGQKRSRPSPRLRVRARPREDVDHRAVPVEVLCLAGDGGGSLVIAHERCASPAQDRRLCHGSSRGGWRADQAQPGRSTLATGRTEPSASLGGDSGRAHIPLMPFIGGRGRAFDDGGPWMGEAGLWRRRAVQGGWGASARCAHPYARRAHARARTHEGAESHGRGLRRRAGRVSENFFGNPL